MRIMDVRIVPAALLLVLAGCAVAVPGRAVPQASEQAAVPPAHAVLLPDVRPDECLLDADGFALLLEGPVTPPTNSGSPSSCATETTRGTPRALAAINVYGVRGGRPADLLRSGRALPGVGDAAVVVDTAGGPTLQVATGDYLVTLAVAEREPGGPRWTEVGLRLVRGLGSGP